MSTDEAQPTPPPMPPVQTAALAPRGNEKIWAILSHLSAFIGMPFLLPLIVFFAMKEDSEFATANAREVLNFHISLLIYTLAMLPLAFLLVGIPLLVVMGIAAAILSIIAAFKASSGVTFRYPLTIRLVH